MAFMGVSTTCRKCELIEESILRARNLIKLGVVGLDKIYFADSTLVTLVFDSGAYGSFSRKIEVSKS